MTTRGPPTLHDGLHMYYVKKERKKERREHLNHISEHDWWHVEIRMTQSGPGSMKLKQSRFLCINKIKIIIQLSLMLWYYEQLDDLIRLELDHFCCFFLSESDSQKKEHMEVSLSLMLDEAFIIDVWYCFLCKNMKVKLAGVWKSAC